MNSGRIISGPHIRGEKTTAAIMRNVSISLIPALLGAVYYFGVRALLLTVLSVAVCVLTEYVWEKITGKQVTVSDFSAVVTGILLAFNMPVTVPLWVLVAADIFSILIVKQMFGGIGANFANPALVGRLLIMVVWPSAVMQYTQPLAADAVSQATVLSSMKAGEAAGYSYLQMFLGEVPGALGETSKLLLLVGFAYLCYMGVVNFSAALTYIATVVVLTFVFGPSGLFTGDILGNLLGGGLILGGLYADGLCIRLPERKIDLCSDCRDYHGGNSYFRHISGRCMLWNIDGQLPGRTAGSALQTACLWCSEKRSVRKKGEKEYEK